jgi:hypothetical protein
MAVGQRIALACNENPTKVIGSKKLLLALQIMIDGCTKADPPTQKKLPVKAVVPELLIKMGYGKSGSIHAQAIGDLSLIAFYYLLRIGEYAVKRQRDRTKWGKKPIERIDTHSLRSGGANALALSGYSDMQIQKMGRWKGATFKEYIREELACYSAGMSSNMKQNFKLVNVSGNAYNDITGRCLEEDYNINISAAAGAV